MASKCGRSSPTGQTPRQASKRSSHPARTSKRKLTYGATTQTRSLYLQIAKWTTDEDEALTKFVLFSSMGDKWPVSKSVKLWEGAATFLFNTCGTKRTSK